MSSYTKIKTVTKVIIYACCFMILVAGGFYLLKKQSITADEQEENFNPVIGGYENVEGSGSNLTLRAPKKVYVGSDPSKYNFKIYASTPNPSEPVYRINIYATKFYNKDDMSEDEYNNRIAKWDNINKRNICIEAIKKEELVLKGKILCNNGKCAEQYIENFISQAGTHRIIATTMRYDDKVKTCAADGSNADDIIIDINKNLIITGVKEVKEGDNTSGDGVGTGGGNFGGDVTDPNDPNNGTSSGSNASKLNLKNPTVINSLTDLWKKIHYWFSVLIGVFSFFAIIIAGFVYMSAGGDDQRATKAKKAIGYAISGLVVATISYAFTLNYVKILNNISSGKDPSKVNEATEETKRDDIKDTVEDIWRSTGVGEEEEAPADAN